MLTNERYQKLCIRLGLNEELQKMRKAEAPFGVAYIDHFQIENDLLHSETRHSLGKPWLTILFDEFSKRVLAFFLSFEIPSYVSSMMVLRECVKRFQRLPQIIITDGGRDFKNPDFQAVLAYYGITHEIRAVHHPRFESVVSRCLKQSINTQLFNCQERK